MKILHRSIGLILNVKNITFKEKKASLKSEAITPPVKRQYRLKWRANICYFPVTTKVRN